MEALLAPFLPFARYILFCLSLADSYPSFKTLRSRLPSEASLGCPVETNKVKREILSICFLFSCTSNSHSCTDSVPAILIPVADQQKEITAPRPLPLKAAALRLAKGHTARAWVKVTKDQGATVTSGFSLRGGDWRKGFPCQL